MHDFSLTCVYAKLGGKAAGSSFMSANKWMRTLIPYYSKTVNEHISQNILARLQKNDCSDACCQTILQ